MSNSDLIQVVLRGRDAALYKAGVAHGKAQAVADLSNLPKENWDVYAMTAQAQAARYMRRFEAPSFWRRLRGAILGWRHGWSSGMPRKG